MYKSISTYAAYKKDTEGASTAWSIFWMICFLVLAGLVIDTANAYKYRQVLTATADSASLAAIMNYREVEYYGLYDQQNATYYTEDGNAPPTGYARARSVATSIGERMMNTTGNGQVISEQDVELGNWDGSDFTAWDGASTPAFLINAARATAYRSSRRTDPNDANPLDTLLLGAFGGLPWWDVAAVSVAETFVPYCYTDGLLARGKVDMSSNNSFYGEICVHGEGYENNGNKNPPVGISLQQGNYFDPEVIVSAPGPFETMVAGSGAGYDDPVYDVYREEQLDIFGVTMFNELRDMFFEPTAASATTLSDNMPDYILESVKDSSGNYVIGDGDLSTPLAPEDFTQSAVNALANDSNNWPIVTTNPNGGGPLNAAAFENLLATATANGTVEETFAGKIYKITCTGGNGKTVHLNKEVLLDKVAVVSSNCEYSLSSDITISDAYLMTDKVNTNGNAVIHGSNGVTIGNGSCDTGTGSRVMARGTIDFASDMSMIRSQIISAEQDVYFAAKADGLEGTSVHAGGNIFLRSQAQAQTCPDAIGDFTKPPRDYYRLVR